MTKAKLYRYAALSLLFGTAAALLWGLWALQRQQSLADDVIRLHVIAASDAAPDQQLKLRVRDAVLEQTEAWLDGTESREEAERILRAHLPELRTVAATAVDAAGGSYGVTATLSRETYPTRDYGTFALPGGDYLSLRVILGEGEGRNWWCVVFPPLCTAAATDSLTEEAAAAGLSEEDLALITQADGGYVIQFKSIELWERWTARLR